jgi:hypothetical protein
MFKKISFILTIVLAGLLAGCGAQPTDTAELEQLQQQLAAIEAKLDQRNPVPDVAGLEGRLDTIEARLETIAETTGGEAHVMDPDADAGLSVTDQAFQVTIAAYLLDTVDFHEMDERLNLEGSILPGDAGKVRRINRALAVTDWPEGLQAKARQLMSVLEQFANALADDDLEAAQPLAAEAHDIQHGFSQTVEKWLAGGVSAGYNQTDHSHQEGAAHVDHTAHHGGLIGMSGDLHLEIVSEVAGEYRVYMTDAFRQPIRAEGVSGMLVLMPGTDHETALPFQVMNGEFLAAAGGPTELDAIEVSIRLDGTPQGHVEMDFSLSYEPGHEHGEAEHDEETMEHGDGN